jgi:hypothetical protein
MCLDSINAMLQAADNVEEERIRAGDLYCNESITGDTTLQNFSSSYAAYDGPNPTYDSRAWDTHAPNYSEPSYPGSQIPAIYAGVPPGLPRPPRQAPPPRSRKGKGVGKNPTGLAGSGTAKAKKVRGRERRDEV